MSKKFHDSGTRSFITCRTLQLSRDIAEQYGKKPARSSWTLGSGVNCRCPVMYLWRGQFAEACKYFNVFQASLGHRPHHSWPEQSFDVYIQLEAGHGQPRRSGGAFSDTAFHVSFYGHLTNSTHFAEYSVQSAPSHLPSRLSHLKQSVCAPYFQGMHVIHMAEIRETVHAPSRPEATRDLQCTSTPKKALARTGR